MERKGILGIGLLLLASLGEAQEQPALAVLKSENEQLRRERDASESRLRMVQDELDEARRAAVASRLEIEALEVRCKKLQEELKQPRPDNPSFNVLPDVLPPLKSGAKLIQGKITAMSTDLHMVQISMGNDAGLKLGQTLDVYRLATEKGTPLYLGTVRVTRVDALASLGEFQRVPGLESAPRLGDDVSNALIDR